MSQTRIPQSPPSSTHNPDKPPQSDCGPESDPDRGPDGRFCKGNKGGPGNPFARQVAALRQALRAAVTGEDIASIAKVMIDKAKQGDVAAARLVIQYSLGKPAETVDPDRLDELEFEQWKREEVTSTSHEVFTGLHACAANVIARALVPAMQQGHFESMQRMIEEREEQRREEQKEEEEIEREWAEEQEQEACRARARAEADKAAKAPASPSRAAPVRSVEQPARVSPVDARMADESGQRATPVHHIDEVERLLQMTGATVTKRGEKASRAANDFVD